jgi:hypothetical protein
MKSAASSLLLTPPPDVNGLQAREAIGRWMQRVEDYEVERRVIQRRQEALQHELARIATAYTGNGAVTRGETDPPASSLMGMLWLTGGEGAIVEVRSDERLMTAIVEMGVSHYIVSGRISTLLALSDTTVAALTMPEG